MTISQKALRAEVERRRGLTLGEAARAVGMPLRTLYRARRVLWVCDPDLERLMDFRLLTIEQAARLALFAGGGAAGRPGASRAREEKRGAAAVESAAGEAGAGAAARRCDAAAQRTLAGAAGRRVEGAFQEVRMRLAANTEFSSACHERADREGK